MSKSRGGRTPSGEPCHTRHDAKVKRRSRKRGRRRRAPARRPSMLHLMAFVAGLGLVGLAAFHRLAAVHLAVAVGIIAAVHHVALMLALFMALMLGRIVGGGGVENGSASWRAGVW